MEKGKVIISPNPIKTTERIDLNGNIIDPRTKRVIVPKEQEYIPPTPQPTTITPPDAPQCPITPPITKDDPMSIQAQIDTTKANLAKLEELKKVKIEEMEKQLKLLKQ